MTRKLNVEKVDSALKRAAHAAVSGGRDARSGRVISSKLAKLANKPLTERCSKRKATSASALNKGSTKKVKRQKSSK